jgi:antitoxin component YwqK of YwqJK toxin-antitoxin module
MLDINFAKNKKDYYDEKIDFTGFQHVYDDDGKLLIKFYHNNGIKEGVYKVYTRYENGLKIVVMDFVNDVQISEPVKRLKRDDE